MVTRRDFVRTVGVGAAGALGTSWIGARGREDSVWSMLEPGLHAAELQGAVIRCRATKIRSGQVRPCLMPSRARLVHLEPRPAGIRARPRNFATVLAKSLGVQPANLSLGCGSTQILRTATHVFTARDKALVGTIPTYEECAGYADMLGHPVRPVSLDRDFRMDLDRMVDASRGAGLVFYCNPNNPVATYVGARETKDFIARVHRLSPETTILVDEAYFEYVTHPDHQSMIPLAIEDPRIVVARTFSKAYGIAGLRLGYAIGHPDALRKMNNWDNASGTSSLNVLALHAGIAAINQGPAFIDAERARNKAARDFTVKWFADRGMKSTESHTNFIFTNIGVPARGFRDGCAKQGVRVGRDFPPFEQGWCRISIGTMEEMQRATAIFGDVLGKKSVAAA